MNPRRRSRLQTTSNNGQSRPYRVDSELKNLNGPPSARALKRKTSVASAIVPGPSSGKDSERVENRVPTTSQNIVSSASSTRVFGAMGRSPFTERDSPVRASSKKGNGTTEESSKLSHDTLLHGQHNDVDETDRQHSNIPVDRHMFTGPLAAAEYERMKKEIETLKETLHESKKVSKRQTKQLEESKDEARAALMAMKDKEIELADVKTKCRHNEELLSIIEASVQCQICMDLPDRPFALNPCGHILCLSCLQEWFRKAPPTLDDMDVDPDELTDPQYILMRSKTCPSCRATVKHRPLPVFMIKSVVTVLKKVNLKSLHASPPGKRHDNDLHTEDNPWKGIFASSEEEEEEEESPLESDSDGGAIWYRHAQFEAVDESNATTDSEMGNEEDEEDDNENGDDGDDDYGDYTSQSWAPPSVSITDYEAADDDDPDALKLLQRGCSQGMLQSFDVSYSHRAGIIVALRSLDSLYDDDEDAGDSNMHRVFLGWNIELEPGDTDGEEYMQHILREIKDVPERWDVTIRFGFSFAMDARRLVTINEAEEFEDTDTEAWISD